MRRVKALAPARIKWGVDLLEVASDNAVLEIGCGSGVAAQHICAKLGRGNYMGLDSSPAAIAAAVARNKADNEAARAMFRQSPFKYENHQPALFHRILAVDVNAFWTDDGEMLRDVRRAMFGQSRFVQVYQPPKAEQRDKIARALAPPMARLFGEVQFTMRTIGGARLLAIVATGVQSPKRA